MLASLDYTPAFDYLMVTWWGHNLMLLIFLLIGFIYFWAVLGIDPSPRTFRRGKRMLSDPVMAVLELAARQDVKGRRGLDEQPGMAVGHADHGDLEGQRYAGESTLPRHGTSHEQASPDL